MVGVSVYGGTLSVNVIYFYLIFGTDFIGYRRIASPALVKKWYLQNQAHNPGRNDEKESANAENEELEKLYADELTITSETDDGDYIFFAFHSRYIRYRNLAEWLSRNDLENHSILQLRCF